VKVLLIGDVSGTRNGQSWPPRGSTIELPDDEAAMLCQQRMATPVVDLEGDVETAVVKDPVEERAVAAPDPLTTDKAPALARRGQRRSNTGPEA
jgi:hypothetical protein